MVSNYATIVIHVIRNENEIRISIIQRVVPTKQSDWSTRNLDHAQISMTAYLAVLPHDYKYYNILLLILIYMADLVVLAPSSIGINEVPIMMVKHTLECIYVIIQLLQKIKSTQSNQLIRD